MAEGENDPGAVDPKQHGGAPAESARAEGRTRRDAKSDYDTWMVGDLDPRNEEIRNICGQREHFIVYFVKGGWLNWFYDAEKIKGAHRLEADAQILLNRGRSWIRQKKEFSEFRNIVAAAMVHGFSDLEDGKPYEGCFSDANEFLRGRTKSTYQIIFVITAIVTALIVGGALFALAIIDALAIPELQRHLYLGGAAGAYGAVLSMLVRAKSSEPELRAFNAKQYVILESVIRVMLGVSFGFLLVLLQKAGFLLQIGDKNLHFIALGGIVAGFNERLVPSLLADIEGAYGSKKRSNPQDGPPSPSP